MAMEAVNQIREEEKKASDLKNAAYERANELKNKAKADGVALSELRKSEALAQAAIIKTEAEKQAEFIISERLEKNKVELEVLKGIIKANRKEVSQGLIKILF